MTISTTGTGTMTAERNEAETNNNNATLLQDTSVLASAYIPEYLKSINLLTIDAPMITQLLPDTQPVLNAINVNLVPKTPCVCTQNHQDSVFHQNHQHIPELRFALNKLPPDFNSQVPLRHVDNIASLEDYVPTFRALLQRERQEVLMLYERYSQYDRLLTFPKSRTARTNNEFSDINIDATTIEDTHTATNIETSTSTTARSVAVLVIPGISDAKPAIEPGDYVLIRPMCLVSLPIQGPPGTGTRKNTWSKPDKTVEIQSQVISVLRSRDLRKDKVVVTWFSNPFQSTFRLIYPQSTYNVRFIPSTNSYNSCMTALDWCASLKPQLAMNLLFPTQAPALPTSTVSLLQTHDNKCKKDEFLARLNKAQTHFVEMVLQRTKYPSQVLRPPMILTGPAGTGKFTMDGFSRVDCGFCLFHYNVFAETSLG
jgi:hypothetical protein